jgi:hypothetical protein
MTGDGSGEYAGVMAAAATVLGEAFTGERRRRILAAGRQAEHDAAHRSRGTLGAERRAEIGSAAARRELAAIVDEARPLSGGSPEAEAEAVPGGTASMTLRINGAAYGVRRVACPDRPTALECFALRKAGSAETHHVSRHADGCCCTCGDFIYRREHLDPRGCKHIKSLVAFGFLAYSEAEAAAAAAGDGGAHGEPPFPRAVRASCGRPPSALAGVLTHGPGLDTWRGGHRA